jgi:hypothetical protein
MEELKQQLETARDFAELHSEQAQAIYVDSYNRRAKDKSFAIGENVIVLYPDSTNKLLSKWQLGTIIDIFNEHSYLVDMPNGAHKQIHANFLRPFMAQVNSVIMADDVDFGDVSAVPVSSDVMLPSRIIDRELIAHLSPVQQQELLDLLDEFAECFSEQPGLCTRAEHKIVTLPGFVPKRLKAYKIRESLKPEVERQIDILLRDGFIVPSNSPMVSPIICVLKPDKLCTGQQQIRIVCDFRYLNKFTQFDPYPVSDLEAVMRKVAGFRFISTFDAKSGYWQTPVEPDSQPLLSFQTHHGLWQWTRTPFGAKNSGSTFCRAIQDVLAPVRDVTVNYVDDMGVGSNE